MTEQLANRPERRSWFRRVRRSRQIGSTTVEAARPKETEPYSPAYMARLIFSSYRFSQGSPGLQLELMKNLVMNNPGRINAKNIDECLPIVREMINQYVNKSQNHRQIDGGSTDIEKKLDDDLTSRVLELKSILNGEISISSPYRISLPAHIIDRDLRYLTTGRPRSTEPDDRPSLYMSHFVYYGLMKRPTGSPEYDEIFSQSVRGVEEYQKKRRKDRVVLDSQLEQLISMHMQHHPEQADLLPEQYRHLAEAA